MREQLHFNFQISCTARVLAVMWRQTSASVILPLVLSQWGFSVKRLWIFVFVGWFCYLGKRSLGVRLPIFCNEIISNTIPLPNCCSRCLQDRSQIFFGGIEIDKNLIKLQMLTQRNFLDSHLTHQ